MRQGRPAHPKSPTPSTRQRLWRVGMLGGGLLAGLAAPVSARAAGPVELSQPAYYAVTKTVTLTNTGQGNALAVQASVTLLPAALAYGKLTLVQQSRQPTSVSRDRFGNLVAHYQLGTLKPGQSVTLVYQYQAVAYDVAYRLPARFPPYHRDALYREYTNPQLEQSQGVNTGAPAIARLDASLTAPAASPLAKARAYFSWIVQHIRYNYGLVPAGGALAVLHTRSGICTDFADLYTAMLRTAHIPARLIDGYVANNGGGQGGFHQWVEFYLPGSGWVAADPTWGQFGYFAGLEDDWHIPLYVGLRPDVYDSWQYAPGTRPYVASADHYRFTVESQPPASSRRVALPILARKDNVVLHTAVPSRRPSPEPLWRRWLHDVELAVGWLEHLLAREAHRFGL